MKQRTQLTVQANGLDFFFSVVVTDDGGGFMWTVYDSDDAHLYGENYDPDTVNPIDEAQEYCDQYIKMNYCG